MKRFYLPLILILMPVLFLSGQNEVLQSKKGIPILPQTDDWAIGIDARPFTKLFNNESNMDWTFMNDNTLIGKKFISANKAHRFKLRLAFYSTSDDRYVIDDDQTIPDPNVKVTDNKKNNATYVTLGYGLEKRTGYGRLQALYGGEFLLGYSKLTTQYTYGNNFSIDNPWPTSYNFGSNIPEPGVRVTFYEPGHSITTTIRGFLGIEYFIAPKLALGGEFGWGISYSMRKEGREEVEFIDPETNIVTEEVHKYIGKYKEFYFDNDNFGGLIYLIFHFNID